LKKVNFNIINNIPIQSLESIKKEFKHQNDSNYKKGRKLNDIDWDYSNKGGDIKCKIVHENKKMFYIKVLLMVIMIIKI